MSLSEALGSYPIVHHFYPIDPTTASQQQTAVYNRSLSPLVAPIIPQQSQEQRKKAPKRKLEEDEVEVKALLTDPPALRPKRAKQFNFDSQPDNFDVSWARPAQHRPQRMDCVEIPVLKFFDRDQYKHIDLSSSSFLGRGHRQKQSRVPRSSTRMSYTPSATPSLSDSSYDSFDSASDQSFVRVQPKRKGGTNVKLEVKAVRISRLGGDDEGSTCHQCRRKSTNQKMRCRTLRPIGPCTLYFCETCIVGRYGEEWHPSHSDWRCPRCRGMCNCSLCLRKAGLGYILDGPAAAELACAPGRLSKSKGKGEATRKKPRTSVRAWLARRGLALGSEEWMEERSRQGVRFVVGMNPPPLGRPSPYKEARRNAYLAANEEEGEASEEELPLDSVSNDQVGAAVYHQEASTSQPKNASTPPDNRESSSRLHRQSTTLAPKPAAYRPPPDTLGYNAALARGVRLIVGRPFLKPGKKRQQRRKAKVESDATASDSDDPGISIDVPPTRTRSRRFPSPGLNQADDEDKDGPIASPPPSPGPGPMAPPHNDPPSTPPPPPEPVLVPTEYYTPSKLDSSHVKDPRAEIGHSYWAFNAFPAHGEHDEDLAPPASSLSHAPLYTYTEPYPDEEQDAPDDIDIYTLNGLKPGSPPSTAMTLSDVRASTSRTPDHYHQHTPDHYPIAPPDAGFAGHGLSSFAALEETWINSSPEHASSMGMDMSTQTEVVSRAVHEALNAAGMHGESY